MSRNRTVVLLIVVVMLLSLAACAKLSSRVTPNTDLDQYETYFVVRHAKDTRLIDEIIRDEMIVFGLKTQSGTIGQKPPGVDVIVTYEDRWAWDMTTYMLSLTIDFRDARNNVLLATGQTYRPSLERKPPKEMAREVLMSILKKANISPKAAAIPKMAAEPKGVTVTEVSLRKKPSNNLSAEDIEDMMLEYGFFVTSDPSSASFSHTLVDNNDGTATDSKTGLMWQKSGSSKSLNRARAKKYVESLNAKSFAGYSDWRMPTVEELASLLEKDKVNGVHLAPVFDNKEKRCWSADAPQAAKPGANIIKAWVVDFDYGKPRRASWSEKNYQAWMDTYVVIPDNYVKAVRSVNQ